MRFRSKGRGAAPAEKIALYGMLIAVAMIFSYIESLVPVFVAVPGVKLGLANIVVLFAIYAVGAKGALNISMIRVVLAGFMFGNMFSIIYSAAGALLSFLVIILLKRSRKFTVVGVSVCGAIAHNVGQILVAMVVTETSQLVYYLPVLCISGIVSGVVIGILAGLVMDRLEKAILKS